MADTSSNAEKQVRALVQEGYAQVATGRTSCCSAPAPGADPAQVHAKSIGYADDDLAGPAAEGNLGLGCGNPTALASLRSGEVVLDLGAGAGFDALIAAEKVAPNGRVIGVDMTPEMLERARTNAVKAGIAGMVEFREGIIEELPVVSDSVDVIISNCVINLSPDKPRVFREAFRVLKPGGRLAVSDIVLTEPLPPAIAELAAAYVGCIAGAALEKDYLGAIEAAGFVDVRFTRKSAAGLVETALSDPNVAALANAVPRTMIDAAAQTLWSYDVEARKP